jgi:hypothetical protein
MTSKLLLLAGTIALAAASIATAQVDSGNKIEYEWGAAHVAAGQAIVLNLSLSADSGPLTLSVEFELHDKSGNTVYRNTATVTAGHSISLAIGPEIRPNVSADLYALVGPEIRSIQPCIKVAWPPGPSGPGTMPPPERLLTPTLEVMDSVTGRVLAFTTNPHTIIGVL